MSFADRIKQIRLERDLNQQDLADMFELKRSTIGKWESGVNKPPADLLIIMANKFRVSIDWLLGNSEHKNIGDYFDANFDTKKLAKEVRELEILESLNRLNELGQKEAVSRIKELTELKKYTL